MAELNWILLYLHLLANLAWIGSLIAVARLLSSGELPLQQRGTVAWDLHRRISDPAFGIALLAGASRLVLGYDYYFAKTKFMVAKLVLALGVIALHYSLGARARHLSTGKRSDHGNAGKLGLALAALVAGVVFLVLRKPF